MAQEVFKRYEKKYKITIEQYEQMRDCMMRYMSADQYGKHTICNIYFDTPDYSMIRSSLDKPVYKEKLRLRSYGMPQEDDTVFIELKKKYDGVVYKRRVPMTLRDARKYLYYGMPPEGKGQILQEVDYAMKFYQPKPMVYLAYERIAFFGKEDSELRVTFDMNIRARQESLDLGKSGYGTLLLESGQMLMEAKIPGAMPLWMSRMFSEVGIYPVSYSKYGTYYQNYIAGQGRHEGGRICA